MLQQSQCIHARLYRIGALPCPSMTSPGSLPRLQRRRGAGPAEAGCRLTLPVTGEYKRGT